MMIVGGCAAGAVHLLDRQFMRQALGGMPGLGSPNAVLATSGAPPRPFSDPAIAREWAVFKQKFMSSDGRIVDTGNSDVSHSEGQGTGLLCAATCDDPEAFNLILSWTRIHLRCRGDALHAWRFKPNAAVPVDDLNNATDGDLLIAAALSRAARSWGRPELGREAAAVGRDVLRMTRRVGHRLLLLPGGSGFDKPDSVIVNPSYYTFGLFSDIAAFAPSPVWQDLVRDGLSLIEEGRFGRWRLPPDWLSVSKRDGSLQPATGWPSRFSFDAVRVALHLAWGGVLSPALAAAFGGFWREQPSFVPAWVDLRTGAVSPYPASPGMRTVMQLVEPKSELSSYAPSLGLAPDYYSAGLTLLAMIAGAEVPQARDKRLSVSAPAGRLG